MQRLGLPDRDAPHYKLICPYLALLSKIIIEIRLNKLINIYIYIYREREREYMFIMRGPLPGGCSRDGLLTPMCDYLYKLLLLLLLLLLVIIIIIIILILTRMIRGIILVPLLILLFHLECLSSTFVRWLCSGWCSLTAIE